jgi:hypothetical protein
MSLPTREQLLERFTYNPDDGTLISYGREAGYVMGSGYRLCSVKKQRIYAHRLIWCMMTGEWPTEEVDHANRNKSDNRWCNLRLASRQNNARNQSVTAKNTSGFKGVSFHKRTGKWRADIQLNGSQKSLGSFDSPELAALAYQDSAKQNFGEFATV